MNTVILLGWLGRDPVSWSCVDGRLITSISVATTESWTDKQTHEYKERTEWHKVICIDRGASKLGTIANQFLVKGSQVYIRGRLKTRKFQDNSGQDQYITEIITEKLEMLDSKEIRDSLFNTGLSQA